MQIKEKIREKYGRIAVLNESCCTPGCCTDPRQSAETVGYDAKELASVPEASVLGVGCGAPLNFAELKEGETVVDLGSGAGIDVFLSSRRIGKTGRAIGVDMTDEMLARARKHKSGYDNVEFRKGDIEEGIPVEDGTVDVVISNCVINLTTDKVRAFSEVHRILKKGGRMVISDLVTDSESKTIDAEKWCSCIDGALTLENYLASIEKAGFSDVRVLQERPYVQDGDGRKITSVVVKAKK